MFYEKNYLISFLTFSVIFSFSQINDKYKDNIKKAEFFYANKFYKKSALTYYDAFKIHWFGTIPDRYNASRSWALANYPDSAFSSLHMLASKLDYSNYQEITEESDLKSLHSDRRWLPIIELIKKNQTKSFGNVNRGRMLKLDSVNTMYCGTINPKDSFKFPIWGILFDKKIGKIRFKRNFNILNSNILQSLVISFNHKINRFLLLQRCRKFS